MQLPDQKNVLLLSGSAHQTSEKLQNGLVKVVNLLPGGAHIDEVHNKWYSNETPEEKIARVLREYDELGQPTKVFAYSAGTDMAVILASQRKQVEELHLVCGKLRNPDNVPERYTDIAPAFQTIVGNCVELLGSQEHSGRLSAITTTYVPRNRVHDGAFYTAEMTVDDSRNIELPNLNHALAIGYAMVVHLPRIAYSS